ncbi:hypothetical protein [Nodosilinea sp. P-1105]|uniref:hypothetical protein n=1 Tax=Nodosilinea sp. P-1105 TaxID=2546229 RepID=UPI001469D751|nr:hypothetical protein [Nodosilinea sp. P-1105]NMF86091.1 hypothetical protein [Nodosilinea sp. P-1105]
MYKLIWFIVAAAIGVSGAPFSAIASSASTTDQELPIAEVTSRDRHSPESLNRVAETMNRRLKAPGETTPTITDALQSSFLDDLLDGLLDEQGELNLPMGLTVYDAMGTTSVGVGTEF